jgi:two-component system response regulator ChvI
MGSVFAEPISSGPVELASANSPLDSKNLKNQPTRLVLVDDDDDFRQTLSGQLTDEGCAVTAFSSGPAALDYLLQTDVADVCLLDWRMPAMGGIEVLRELRRRQIMTPVIFLTGLRDDAYEEEALRDGAVDFINKARRLSVLLKRIELIIEGQRASVPPQPTADTETHLRRGPLEFHLDTNRVTWHGRPLELTRAEFRVLNHLAARPGIDVPFEDLYDLAHENVPRVEGDDGYRTNVRSLIKRIRNKFREIDHHFDRIQSYPRFGYRWSMK